MSVKSLHISLPEKLRQFVELQTKNAGFGTKSDYVQQLIRKDMKRREQERLKNLLLESLASDRKEYTEKEWSTFRNQIKKSVGV